MAHAESLQVEVVYALPDQQTVVALTLPLGATVRDAVMQSGLLQRFPDIDLAQHHVGIFGRLTALNTGLKDGDRIEIYRPLTNDPKQVRRELAKLGRSMGRRHD
ncbi:MAG: RnfH family protein [Gammaproteobacteria bacterium]